MRNEFPDLTDEQHKALTDLLDAAQTFARMTGCPAGDRTLTWADNFMRDREKQIHAAWLRQRESK